MTTMPNTRQSVTNRELNRAMAACLRLILKDLWAQYRSVTAEAERLKKAGGAVGNLYRRVCSLDKEVAVRQNGKANTDRRVQRTRV